MILDQSDSISSSCAQHFTREDLQRALASDTSVSELLTFLTTKFNKLIDSHKAEELEKRSL